MLETLANLAQVLGSVAVLAAIVFGTSGWSSGSRSGNVPRRCPPIRGVATGDRRTPTCIRDVTST